MQAYLGGQDVSLAISLVASDGSPIEATAVQYRLTNQDEIELVAKVALTSFTAGDDEVIVAIPGALNTLGASSVRELRVVELYVTCSAGVLKLTTEYILEAEAVLRTGLNSFQTYSAALLAGYELPNMEAWNDASKGNRINALIAARRNIGKLYLRYIAEADMTRLAVPWESGNVTMLTADQFATLPTDMREAICRAQVIEADFLLGGDPVGDIRRSGVMSSTVGEASQFFRTSKPYEGPVCKRALQELGKYIAPIKRVGRG